MSEGLGQSIPVATAKSVLDRGLDWLVEHAGIAIVPAVAYFLTYQYEAGYCSYFGVPRDFVEVDITKIIGFSGAILFLIVNYHSIPKALAFDIGPVSRSAGNRSSVNASIRLMLLYGIPGALLYLGVRMIFDHFVLLEINIMGLFVFALLCDVAQASRNRGGRKFADRLIGPITAVKKVLSELGRFIALAILLWYAVTITSAFGGYSAARTKVFSVTEGSPKAIVIRVYTGNAVCVVIKPDSGELTRDFYICRVDKETLGLLRKIKLDSLKPPGPI